MNITRLAQRHELDFKIDTQEYRVDYELDCKNQYVIVGAIKKFKDKFDVMGQPIYQEHNPKLYRRVEDYIERWIWE